MIDKVTEVVKNAVSLFESSSKIGKLFITGLLIVVIVLGVWWVDSNRSCPYNLAYGKQDGYVRVYIDCEQMSEKKASIKHIRRLANGFKLYIRALP